MIKKKGFTLIEVILVLALMSVVLGVIYQFFLSSSRSLNEAEIRSNLQFEGQHIQDSFTKYGSQGNSITTLNGTTPQAVSTQVNLNNLTISLYDGTDHVGYTYDNGTKTLTENHGVNKILSNKISSITIKTLEDENYDVASGITVDVTLEDKGIQYSITSKILFRNKGVTP
ncbi:type II secretion system protein [Clostridium sp. C8-1-8]|uniref:type II secretion system protein n=1 Tax=Clostridium sp. C8-1-8 TaxID=2698831 RepID=UPI00136E7EED|nr:type II secretion system protein [Clostridium sp. C8-1-8]